MSESDYSLGETADGYDGDDIPNVTMHSIQKMFKNVHEQTQIANIIFYLWEQYAFLHLCAKNCKHKTTPLYCILPHVYHSKHRHYK